VAGNDSEKLALVRAWLRGWRRSGFWLSSMPDGWRGTVVQTHSGKFAAMNKLLPNKAEKTAFERTWLPRLLELFTEAVGGNKYRLLGTSLSLQTGGEWAYCEGCRTTQRPFPGRPTCVNCGRPSARLIDPDADAVFQARKGYYRASTIDVMKTPPVPPMALMASEHTAQLNTAQADQVFSQAEEHELLFQDVDLGADERHLPRTAIDVLSCTTTMEVGIDIGQLSGVALRNMPPARANYQQRAGRAGRRGNAIATVTAFGSADSHDEHYFTHSEQMISGAVVDPRLTLHNSEIARRHVTAYLLQRYYQARLADVRPEDISKDKHNLFAVLGTVAEFRAPHRSLNRVDLEHWLRENRLALTAAVDSWLPSELPAGERQELLDTLLDGTLSSIDAAIAEGDPHPDAQSDGHAAPRNGPGHSTNVEASAGGDDAGVVEVPAELGEEAPSRLAQAENLLDRLLYKGVLPRYAFPTDVATFYVFDRDQSTLWRPAFRFAPSQGLSIALSQYAPGKDVWVGGRRFRSGALYSPFQGDRFHAWESRRLYFECTECHYAVTVALSEAERGDTRQCPACTGANTLGPARHWLRPPGFAHPATESEETSPDDSPPPSYVTRAKLSAPAPNDEGWSSVTERLRTHAMRQPLLVTNRGPREEGYAYCTQCGVIAPSILPGDVIGSHQKPYPDERNSACPGGGV
jgi:hypothetical protein